MSSYTIGVPPTTLVVIRCKHCGKEVDHSPIPGACICKNCDSLTFNVKAVAEPIIKLGPA